MGCSPSALRTVMHTLERLILTTTAAWEKEDRPWRDTPRHRGGG